MTPLRTSPSALTFSKLLGEGPMARVALEAALAMLESAAFIVSTAGNVIHANPEGDKKLAASSDRLRAEVARAVESIGLPRTAGGPLVTPLRCGKTKPYFLVIFRPRSSLSENVDYAARLWELTPRQRDVLVLVAEGFSNKTIAVKLASAERTIETHLTAIFQKSGISGRTALLAAVARNQP